MTHCSYCNSNVNVNNVHNFIKKDMTLDEEYFCDFHDIDPYETICEDCFNGLKDEYLKGETDDWVCSECGHTTDTIYTINEWCDDYHIKQEDREYLHSVACSTNMNTDICESCFIALCESAGVKY